MHGRAVRLQAAALAELRTRDDDDPTIALLDAWAVTCDVLTFYNERLAQESFLGTAEETVSLQELGRLIGYQLDPGVAAETQLAFTLERPPTVPALSTDPGLAPPTTPAEVTLPVGLRVQSIPGPGETPQTFETVEEVVARPEWSSMPAARTRPDPPGFGDMSAWLRGTNLNLNPGAAILITGRTPATTDFVNDHWDVRLATDVTLDRGLDATRVEFEWPLGSFSPTNLPAGEPAAYVLRRRFDVFGHNAPVWPTLDPTYRAGYARSITSDTNVQGTIVEAGEWWDFAAASTAGSDLVVDLDGAHADVVTGSWVVVSQEDGTFYRELYEVVERAELSRAEFGISGTVTRLTLRGELRTFGTPRQVTVFGVSEPLELTERPDESDVTGDELVVDGDATTMQEGRTICCVDPVDRGRGRGRRGGERHVRGGLPGRRAAHADHPPGGPHPQLRPHHHGGAGQRRDGDARRDGPGDPRQRRRPAQLPEVRARARSAHLRPGRDRRRVRVDTAGERGRRRVAGGAVALRRRAERADLHSRALRGPEPRDGRAVRPRGLRRRDARRPGDHRVAQRQSRLPQGAGSAGNLAANRLAQPLDRPLGVKAATNPLPSAGGADPEPAESARRTMPISVRTLGRAVSLQDYADFSLAFAGISRAEARVLALRSGRTVVVSVCGPDAGPAAPSTLTHLRDALVDLGDPLVLVEVVPAEIALFRVALTVGVDPAYEKAAVLDAVDGALHAAFDPAAGELATPVAASAVIAAAAGVAGVVAVDLDRLYRLGSGPLLSPRLFATVASVAADGTPTGTELLGLAEEPFDWLEAMT